MRRLVIAAAIAAFALTGCATTGSDSGTAGALGVEQILPYVHIDGFGTPTDTPAWIAWEFEALSYVKYQVAYTSCTCRPESVNARSLLYVEVTKDERGGKIRKVTFDYWGDSPKFPSGLTRQDVEKGFMKTLPGNRADGIEAIDVVAGATVTTVNLRQILDALLDYHDAKYPAVGMNDDNDAVDATSSATSEGWE
ncbi:MAG TPA: hypothetical protein P5298_10475 [Spirochaetia bacterium]|nr:hypothetical protein [Spirochaetales bacterium]HRW24825.1 hypothetical protein [Spirochaetia bacterium]